MNELLTMEEMMRSYPGEWVLIENPETDDALEILKGQIVCHSRDVKLVDEEMRKRKPAHAAILFMGEVPENMVFAL